MKARGWTIVEFIIALLLGLVIALLSSGLLLGASSAYRHHRESLWLNDSGRYALEIMTQSLRQAAYQDWDRLSAPVELDDTVSAGIGGWDARSLSREGDGIAAPLAAVDGVSDVLAVRFSGSGSGGNGDGSLLNCAGFGVAAPATEAERNWSIFYVDQDAQGESELRCKYRGAHGWGSDAIVRGVDSFQVLYGLDTDAVPDGVPNVYVNASAIEALDAGLSLVGATPAELQRDRNRKTYWKRVCSVRVALLLRGAEGSLPDGDPAQFDLFGKAYSAAHAEDMGVHVDERRMPDSLQHRARQVFTATVLLRNRGGN